MTAQEPLIESNKKSMNNICVLSCRSIPLACKQLITKLTALPKQ